MSRHEISSVEGVLFDMDGVLCDSEPFICKAAIRMFSEDYNLDVLPADFKPFVGAGENRFIGGVADKYGCEIDLPKAKTRTYDIYLEVIQSALPPLKGAVEFVTQCKALGLKCAVATSADEVKLHGNLREIGLAAETFDATVNGLEVERRKPHPDIFLLAAERIGVSPRRCLVVEDAPNGVEAAKAAGAVCLGLTTSFSADVLTAAGADFIAPDLASVPGELMERLGQA
jgi:beta-phosphoglucomutase